MVICYEPDQKLTKAPDLVFEVTSKSTAKHDDMLRFDLYQSEAVKYYVLMYLDSNKAKLHQLLDFKYQKLGDSTDKNFLVNLKDCDFNFNFIWRKNN